MAVICNDHEVEKIWSATKRGRATGAMKAGLLALELAVRVAKRFGAKDLIFETNAKMLAVMVINWDPGYFILKLYKGFKRLSKCLF